MLVSQIRPRSPLQNVLLLTHRQMLEKSLLDSDPEVAEIMVCSNSINCLSRKECSQSI
jgi:aspartate carbamoyltransferase regulatory subunit